jgi:hypothetical protein
MRHDERLAVLLIVAMAVILQAWRGGAQPFYTGSGNMFRVFGCPPNATLTVHGAGPFQQGECTLYETGNVVPAVPIETWISGQVTGAITALQAQNGKLEAQVAELRARVQALEGGAKQPPASPAPRSTPGPATK